jgi:hypothetical protein
MTQMDADGEGGIFDFRFSNVECRMSNASWKSPIANRQSPIACLFTLMGLLVAGLLPLGATEETRAGLAKPDFVARREYAGELRGMTAELPGRVVAAHPLAGTECPAVRGALLEVEGRDVGWRPHDGSSYGLAACVGRELTVFLHRVKPC